jgi:hypothetical protein
MFRGIRAYRTMPRRHVAVIVGNLLIGNAVLVGFNELAGWPNFSRSLLIVAAFSASLIAVLLLRFELAGIVSRRTATPVLSSLRVSVLVPVLCIPLFFTLLGATALKLDLLNPFGWIGAEIGLAMLFVSKEGVCVLLIMVVVNTALFRWVQRPS